MKLSIITVNLNNSKGLEKTIKSVIKQTFSDYEFIVIDGKSFDTSIEVIKRYRGEITYWISEPDNGIYHAMNKGIEKAIGEYCFFLNSGDILADRLVLENVFESEPTEDILFGNLYVTKNGKIIGKAYGKVILAFSDIYAHTVKHQASFIKRNLFKRFGNYEENIKIVADWEFFIKVLGFGNTTYKYFDMFISYFDCDGLSTKNADAAIQERQMIINENIPSRMQYDFEFLLRYKKYERLYLNKFTFFLIRLIGKLF